MKTNLILASTILACASLSFAAGGTSHSQTQGGTAPHPTQDSSQTVYDQTINPARIDADRNSTNNTRQNRVSTDSNRSNIDRATKDTDNSGQKSDQAPSSTTRE
jgi:hypothetical protein